MEGLERLNSVSVGQSVIVVRLNMLGNSRRRMLDMGLTPGTRVDVVRKSPLGDPTAYCVRNSIIALREVESRHIMVEHC
ncbi:MAG: FeoA family protein [Bacillota bacterium]|nr:FeoA family protein [Bacillota bacterium]